jgi:hypothetical protein
MRRHLDQLEASPFDGCVFHLGYAGDNGKPGRFTWELWGTRRFRESDLAAGLADLRATPFRRFRSNFLRINVTPGRTDWFDDYSTILANVELAASVARRGGAAGVFFDTEPYEGPLFDYAKQRDARTKSYARYEAQARRRGREVMRALERGWPGLTVFLTLGVTQPYIWAGSNRALAKKQGFALLAPFVDGMILAASDSARIVDGTEASYWVRAPREVDNYHKTLTVDALDLVSDRARYKHVVSRGFGIWLDHDSPRKKWHADAPDSNYRTPAQLRAVVARALTLADDYVWVYGQTPKWWTEAGGPSKLPRAYDRALRDARRDAGLDP